MPIHSAFRNGTSSAADVRPVEIPFVDLRAAHAAHRREITEAVDGVLTRSDFVLGAPVEQFEQAFAAYCDAAHAVGVDSGYSALELMLRAHDIGPGDEVITAANTFVATVGAIEAAGATAVLADVRPDTLTIDPAAVESAVTPATRAVIPVHLYGQPADMDAIDRIAGAHHLIVLEDAAQAHGARHRGRRAGALGDAAAFSFYPAKNLGALGDGGMVVTSDGAVAERVRRLRNLGAVRKYHHEEKGFNRRLDTLHAAVLGIKLPHLDRNNAARRRIAMRYTELLDGLSLTTPVTAEAAVHVFHLFVIETDERDALQQHLARDGVATGIHYPVPIHRQPAYRSLDGFFPVTETAAKRILSLPIYPEMPESFVERTARSVRRFFTGRR